MIFGRPYIHCYDRGCPWNDGINICKRWYDADKRCLNFNGKVKKNEKTIQM